VRFIRATASRMDSFSSRFVRTVCTCGRTRACVRASASALRSSGGHFESMSARRGGDYQHRRVVTPKLDGFPFLDDAAPTRDSRRAGSIIGRPCPRDDAPSPSSLSSSYLEMVLSSRAFYFREETPTSAAATSNGPRPISKNLYF